MTVGIDAAIASRTGLARRHREGVEVDVDHSQQSGNVGHKVYKPDPFDQFFGFEELSNRSLVSCAGDDMVQVSDDGEESAQ